MRAVQLDRYGRAEDFRVVDLPVPAPQENEVLIRVHLAGLIFADTQMRRGDYVNLPASLPFTPGREVAGVIAQVGAGVRDLAPGMRVTADMHTGGYAEYAVAPAGNVVRLPERVSFEQGLVYHINLRIAYLAYYVHGKIQPTETMLVHAAAGGIGTLITQIAKRREKNTVIALASSDDKAAYCLANGADHAINYCKTDYVQETLRLTGGRGVDVSLNSVGGPTFATDPLAIRPLGRWVIYGYAAGKTTIDPYPVIMPKSLTLNIFSVYTVRERDEYRRATEFLDEWLRTQELDSVTRTFPLEEIVTATRWIEQRHSYGKTALAL